ncbi:VanZ family protein [Paraliobacillus sediminis]|uniref:VanZ family protein n=1 Tax=Paraliobacillus sediminis TaxID=1885916 RepID=UPI0013C2A59F|nr:VanZ family protein [Paraliobacillus sediminis]
MLQTIVQVGTAIGLPIIVLYIIIKFFTKSFKSFKKEIVNIMMLLYTVILVYLVWLDSGVVLTNQSYNFIPFKTISLYVNQLIEGFLPLSVIAINLLGNVVVTVPIGLWLSYKQIAVKRAMIYAAAVPVMMEVGQFIFHELGYVTRTVDIDDWILNFAGIVIGYFVFKWIYQKR